MTLNQAKFVLLTILDGWGLSAPGPGNAISLANTVNMNRFWATYPHGELSASGESVGLPRGETGNTETGHLNLGAGRIVYQDLVRINMSIAEGTYFTNPALIGAIEHAKKNNSGLHLMGLVGAGGVHSNIEHLLALIQLARRMSFPNVYLHLFTDGRDSPPTSSKIYLKKIRDVVEKEQVGQIASIMGRYWSMDRDLRWDRTAKAYACLTRGEGHLVKTPEEAIDISYAQGVTDEFVEPALMTDSAGKPISLIKDNDAVIFFNFRVDRPRQLSRAFVIDDFSKAGDRLDFDPYLVKYTKKHVTQELKTTSSPFDRGKRLQNLFFVIMTKYDQSLIDSGAKVAFPPEMVEVPLGKAVSEAGFRQLRVAESEKERFVTFYFDGQKETAFPGEERIIVPSPKVMTYDQTPAMSAMQITDNLLDKMKSDNDIKFVLINFANPDMIGHTGNIGATVRACEVVDECIGKIANFVLAYGGVMLITADHGNAEEMIDAKTGEIETEHNSNNVPFIAVGQTLAENPPLLSPGLLADVAPTILNLLNIKVPTPMTGRNLLKGIF